MPINMFGGNIMENIKESLKQYMAEKDLTIADVAKLLGRSQGAIWKFLHGKTNPHFQTLYRIIHLIEKDLNDINKI